MLSKEDRQHILREFLSNIHGVTDIEYQKRVWIRGEGPECDDFDETVCQFYDRYEEIVPESKEFELTKTQYQELVKFHDVFEAFVDGPRGCDPPEEFIHTPEWKVVMEAAKRLLKVFDYKDE